jgi:hypothetical protein
MTIMYETPNATTTMTWHAKTTIQPNRVSILGLCAVLIALI